MSELLTRRIALGTSTYDEATRTCEAVVASNTPVPRNGQRPDNTFGPWLEVLAMEGADLSRFIGAPVLVDHRYDSDSRVGVVTEVRREGSDRLVATLKFSTRPAVDDLVRDVRDGVASQVSIGYRVTRWSQP